MRKLIIGIDGGGTKTCGVLYNEKGEEHLRAEFGFSNFSIDQEVAIKNIHKTIEALLVERQKDDEVILIMGISGASKLTHKKSFIEELEKTYQLSAELVTDAHIAIHSIDKKEDEHVIMAIGGTGSAVMILEGDDYQLIGGYGYLLGDEGSAYHLVIQALKKMTDHFDRGLSMTPLLSHMMRVMNVNNREDLVNFVYQSRKTELAQLAKNISDLAVASDKEAHDLLINEGRLLAEQVLIAASRFKKKTKIRIALRGGFIINAPFVKESFIDELSAHLDNFVMEEHPNEAVLGAYRLGIKKLFEVTSC
jgi:N-acetylglucosamine kinase-like BadF-type ATPase